MLIDLALLNRAQGFKISKNLNPPQGGISCAVNRAGDINADGIDDIVIGDYGVGALGRQDGDHLKAGGVGIKYGVM